MLALMVIAIVEYVIARREFDEILDNLKLIDKSDQRIAEFMNVLSKAQDLYLLKINVF